MTDGYLLNNRFGYERKVYFITIPLLPFSYLAPNYNSGTQGYVQEETVEDPGDVVHPQVCFRQVLSRVYSYVEH